MEEIKFVSAKDTGRIAVDMGRNLRVEVVGINRTDVGGSVFCFVKDKYNYDNMLGDFCLIGGRLPMYWEDTQTVEKPPKMTLDISPVIDASRCVNQDRTVLDVMAYLAAETGECADWLVNPDRRNEDLLGECTDVIICAIDLALIHKRDTSDLTGQELVDEVLGHLNNLLKTKSEKWVAKHG